MTSAGRGDEVGRNVTGLWSNTGRLECLPFGLYQAAALFEDPVVYRNVVFSGRIVHVVGCLACSVEPVVHLTPEPYPTCGQTEALGDGKSRSRLPLTHWPTACGVVSHREAMSTFVTRSS